MDGVAEGMAVCDIRDAVSENLRQPFAEPLAFASSPRSHLHHHRIYQRNRPPNRQVSPCLFPEKITESENGEYFLFI